MAELAGHELAHGGGSAAPVGEVEPGPLHGMQARGGRGRGSFDGRHLVRRPQLPHGDRTGVDRLAVEVAGARLADVDAAAVLRAVDPENVAQHGQIMAAVALVRRVAQEGREITDADLDRLRNICRCGTYFRIRGAIRAGAAMD
ncbi:hypothetical protein [Nonomuraea maheshkhaliensis]|uniref:hypothetical protein n=1 Tax=Nonomuraea maheshkhaliensis TaxID=419590 RepID=UPI0031F88D87